MKYAWTKDFEVRLEKDREYKIAPVVGRGSAIPRSEVLFACYLISGDADRSARNRIAAAAPTTAPEIHRVRIVMAYLVLLGTRVLGLT